MHMHSMQLYLSQGPRRPRFAMQVVLTARLLQLHQPALYQNLSQRYRSSQFDVLACQPNAAVRHYCAATVACFIPCTLALSGAVLQHCSNPHIRLRLHRRVCFTLAGVFVVCRGLARLLIMHEGMCPVGHGFEVFGLLVTAAGCTQPAAHSTNRGCMLIHFGVLPQWQMPSCTVRVGLDPR